MNKIGKRDFKEEDLTTNLDALLTAIARKRPETIKGKYFSKVLIKTSMGPHLKLNLDRYHELAKP
jgi:large subunit ribosomal protein L1